MFLLLRLARKPRKCTVCKAETFDLYRDENDKAFPLCRMHIMERWKKDVSASKEKMVVIEPDFVSCPHAYLYATIDQLEAWQYPKKALENISSILANIANKTCAECDKIATIAYFKKEDYPVPQMEKIVATPTYLCTICMIKKIAPHISGAAGPFIEGIYAPTHGPGVYHVQEF